MGGRLEIKREKFLKSNIERANDPSVFYSRKHKTLIFLATCHLLTVTERPERRVETQTPARRIEEGSRSEAAPLLIPAGVKDTGKRSSGVDLGGLLLKEHSEKKHLTVCIVIFAKKKAREKYLVIYLAA